MTAPDPTPLAYDAHGTRSGRGHRQLSHIHALESESIHIIREVAAEFERPVLLFSGGKDSAVMLRLAEKAFAPAPIPFPVMHVDTGHNFPGTRVPRPRIAELGVRLVVASVPEAIAAGRVVEDRPGASRNRLQTTVLLEAIADHRFDAVFGGGRRDEEKARAKERVFSHRDEFGQWDPKNQRPELWNLYRRQLPNTWLPLSNWTELDVAVRLASGKVGPRLLRARRSLPPRRDDQAMGCVPATQARSRSRRRCASGRWEAPGFSGRESRPHRDEIVVEIAASDHRAGGAPTTALRGGDGGPEARGVLLSGLLRLATAGSVTTARALIGRLLYDSKQILEDQLAAVERTSRERGDSTDLALLTDGLRAGDRASRSTWRTVPDPRRVHHRRHPRAHSVHPQHGDGRVDSQPG
jgi:sulfate adenylyltransferase subunit 2